MMKISEIIVSVRVCPGCNTMIVIPGRVAEHNCHICGFVLRYFVTQKLTVTP